MNTGRILFSQLMDVIPKYQVRKIVARHKGDYRVRSFTCWDQLLCLCFGQLTFRQSLRDLTSTLNALGSQRYHMGITTKVALSTFSRANARRPWQIYHQLDMLLIEQVRQLYYEDSSDLESVYALDRATIDLCLSLFPWAEFRSLKRAIKLHTLMDLEDNIPTFIHISDGCLHDVNVLDMIPIMASSIYIMDPGYLDFEWLFALPNSGGKFVIRARKNLQFYRKSSASVDRSTGLQCDQTIRLTSPISKLHYPQQLRRVHLIDKEHDKDIVLLSNITSCSAEQIADYYKQRWQIGLFFKWIKGHLRIKAFYGQSVNTVKTQIWTAICIYLIIIILQKSNHFNVNFLRRCKYLVSSYCSVYRLKSYFSEKSLTHFDSQSHNQLGLFEF